MLRLFKNLTKKEVLCILISLVLIVCQVWLELKMPDYMSSITQLVQTEGSSMSDILTQGFYMLVCAFGSLLSAIVVGFFAATTASSFATTLRKILFDKIFRLSTNEMKKFSVSSLITRTTNDITQVDMIIGMGLQMMAKAPIMATWAILKILDKGFEWSVLTGACVIILLITVALILIRVLPRFSLVQKLIDNVNKVTGENLLGIRVIRAFNAEKFQTDRFETVNNELTSLQMSIKKHLLL